MNDHSPPVKVTLSLLEWARLIAFFGSIIFGGMMWVSSVQYRVAQNRRDNERQDEAIQRNAQLLNDTARTLARVQGALDKTGK